MYLIFQSTLSMRRATNLVFGVHFAYEISIHALHEESDKPPWNVEPQRHISIHALHEESDMICIICSPETHHDFNPRSP